MTDNNAPQIPAPQLMMYATSFEARALPEHQLIRMVFYSGGLAAIVNFPAAQADSISDAVLKAGAAAEGEPNGIIVAPPGADLSGIAKAVEKLRNGDKR